MPTGILNKKSEAINPATEDKQDGIISSISDVKNNQTNGTQIERSYNKQSTLNSTSTPLEADAEFVGTAESLENYSVVTASVYTDKASDTRGLVIEYSCTGDDNTWYWNDGYTINAMTTQGQGKVFTSNKNAKYFRVRYKNGGEAQTLMTMFTVPRGKKLYISQGTFSTNSNKGARVSLFTRQLDGGILYPWRIRYRAFTFSGNENFPFETPFQIPEKTDVEVRVNTPTSAGTTSCGATFEGWYELSD